MHRLALFIAAVGLTLGVAAAATADGVTPAKLTNAGWTCFNDPGAPRIVCSDPRHARPPRGIRIPLRHTTSRSLRSTEPLPRHRT